MIFITIQFVHTEWQVFDFDFDSVCRDTQSQTELVAHHR